MTVSVIENRDELIFDFFLQSAIMIISGSISAAQDAIHPWLPSNEVLIMTNSITDRSQHGLIPSCAFICQAKAEYRLDVHNNIA